MTKTIPHLVNRFVIDTDDTFDDLRQRFESLVPTIDFAELTDVIESGDLSRVRQYTAEHAPNSFVNFWTFDPTPMMALVGHRTRAITYMVGNNVIAETMFRHDPGVMLYAPLRTAIYEDNAGGVHLSIDQPSSRFASFADPRITEVGSVLDTKLAALLRLLGVPVPLELEETRRDLTHSKGADMKDTQIHAQYSTGLSRQNIEQALITAGKDLDHLQPADLGLLEDFHTMGRIATSELVDLVGITSEHEVLDAGSGIGGTARYIADRCGCTVTAVDLTQEYCETACWLNRLVGLDKQITVRRADVTALPFADATFQVVFSQHVQMNVADKASLYREARRVMVSGGRLAMWDIVSGEGGELDFPLPWADEPGLSHLAKSDRLRATVESSGFAIEHWNDRTEQAGAIMQTVLTLPPGLLGLHAFVPDFAEKAKNLTNALTDGRLRVIQGVAEAIVR